MRQAAFDSCASTMYDETKTGLSKWFLAIYLVTSSKGGISAMELQRQIGFGSYGTAWTWLHKIRRAMIRPGRESLAAGRGRRDPGRRRQVRQVRARRRRQDRRRRRGRGQARQGPETPAGPTAARGSSRRLGQEPRGLHRRRHGQAAHHHHRRLGRLSRPRSQRLCARANQPLGQLGRRQLAAARHPPRLQPRQTLAPRHPPRCRPARASATLPRRVRLPLQPQGQGHQPRFRTASPAWSRPRRRPIAASFMAPPPEPHG